MLRGFAGAVAVRDAAAEEAAVEAERVDSADALLCTCLETLLFTKRFSFAS
jgi:hypothetical protein